MTSPTRRSAAWALGLALVLGAFGAVPVGAVPADPVTAYVGVIDAGSSGSRIGLYETRGTGRDLEVAAVHFYNPNDKGGPGIRSLSSFAATPDRAGPEGIAPLLAELDGVLAAAGVPKAAVPITVLATAGMRNVERDSPAAAAPLYASVRAVIEAAGYRVTRVGTMAGQDEAVYSWSAVNYLTGALRRGGPTRGIAEIGGASAQVAFATTDRGRDVVTRRIMGERRRLLAVSYLGLGRNDARVTMIPTDAPAVGSPCWPNNGAGSVPSAYDLGNRVPVAAAPSRYSWSRCADVALDAVRTTVRRPENVDRIRPRSIRDVAGFAATRFVGIDKLAESFEEFGYEPGSGTWQAVGRAVRDRCSGAGAWTDVLAVYGGEVSSTSENGCANTTYVGTWLFDRRALAIVPRHLAPKFAIDGTTVTWTLGYVVATAP